MLNTLSSSLPLRSVRKRTSSAYLIRMAVFSALSFVFLVYLILSPRLNQEFYYHDVLFRPLKCSQVNCNWYGRKGVEVSFPSPSGGLLSGVYLPCPGARRTVLMHHGMGENMNSHNIGLDVILEPDTAIFSYDYAGFGKSTGDPTIEGIAQDGRAAYEFLVNKLKVDPKTIVHYGVSLGTGPAAHTAASAPCAGLVLFAPYKSLKSAARDSYSFLGIYPDWLLVDFDFDLMRDVKNLNVPLLLIHGARDRCIQVHNSDELYAAAPEPKTFIRIEDGGHTQFTKIEQVKTLQAFIASVSH